jgi:hypothetical protein
MPMCGSVQTSQCDSPSARPGPGKRAGTDMTMPRGSGSGPGASESGVRTSTSGRWSIEHHNSPRLSFVASSAARAEACALVWRISMSGLVQPATAMSPDSEPPAASHLWAAVCRRRWGWKPTMPAERALSPKVFRRAHRRTACRGLRATAQARRHGADEGAGAARTTATPDARSMSASWISPGSRAGPGSGSGGAASTSSSTRSGGSARGSRRTPCRSRRGSWAGRR